jgi:hypothetical protein
LRGLSLILELRDVEDMMVVVVVVVVVGVVVMVVDVDAAVILFF